MGPVLGRRVELPLEEGLPYIPEFYSGWEPPATDPQGRPWEDPVEKQLQHERRRRQVRLKLQGNSKLPQVTQRGPGSLEAGRPRLTCCPFISCSKAPPRSLSMGECQPQGGAGGVQRGKSWGLQR